LNILLRCCKSTHTKRGQVCDGECEFQNANSMVFCGEQMSCMIQKGNILDFNG